MRFCNSPYFHTERVRLLDRFDSGFDAGIPGDFAVDHLEDEVVGGVDFILRIQEHVAVVLLAGVEGGGLLDQRVRIREEPDAVVAAFEAAVREFADAPGKDREKHVELGFAADLGILVSDDRFEFGRNHDGLEVIGRVVVVDGRAAGHDHDGGNGGQSRKIQFFHFSLPSLLGFSSAASAGRGGSVC